MRFRLPAFLYSLVLGSIGIAAFAATASVTLSPTVSPPLGIVKIAATGFDPGTSVDVYFDLTDQLLAVANAAGKVSTQIAVPQSAHPGPHWITLEERATRAAAQAKLTVRVDWPMRGFADTATSYNPLENSIGPYNAASLTTAWVEPVSQLGNPTPFVQYQGNLIGGTIEGTIFALGAAGKPLWTASPNSDMESVNPAAYQGNVFFGTADGRVLAYKAACRSDGGRCAPLWSHKVGTAVTAALSIHNGQVYAPSADGTVHPLNPLTGVPGTPISGGDTSAAITTPVVFDADGSYYYGVGSTLHWQLRCCTGTSGYGGTLSPIAVYNGGAYFTTGDGMLQHFAPGNTWGVATSGSGCTSAPAVANNVVYAGGCSTLAAYDAGTGVVLWQAPTPGPVGSLVVANNVVYACAGAGGEHAIAYSAANGASLWEAGICAGPPVVANGVVSIAGNAEVSNYKLTAPPPNLGWVRPDPLTLKPDLSLRPQAPAR